jgi:hypothetical protein
MPCQTLAIATAQIVSLFSSVEFLRDGEVRVVADRF